MNRYLINNKLPTCSIAQWLEGKTFSWGKEWIADLGRDFEWCIDIHDCFFMDYQWWVRIEDYNGDVYWREADFEKVIEFREQILN